MTTSHLEKCMLQLVHLTFLLPLASGSKKLTLLYLCNDVVQNSKKSAPEYTDYFARVLPKVFEVFRDASPKEKSKVDRVLGIWKERRSFDADLCADLSNYLGSSGNSAAVSKKRKKPHEGAPAEGPKHPVVSALELLQQGAVMDAVISAKAEELFRTFDRVDSMVKRQRAMETMTQHHARLITLINRRTELKQLLLESAKSQQSAIDREIANLATCESYIKRIDPEHSCLHRSSLTVTTTAASFTPQTARVL